MKESIRIALGYVKSNDQKFGINPEIFTHNIIHINALEGAIPKEGPSAGIALVTVLISALTKKTIPHDLGMTGEINLRGQVGKIGGLKEKIIAAHRSELKTIIIPKDNKRDLKDIPPEILEDKSFKIILVEDYEEV
jgi:ATP-dependent Lon protease